MKRYVGWVRYYKFVSKIAKLPSYKVKYKPIKQIKLIDQFSRILLYLRNI